MSLTIALHRRSLAPRLAPRPGLEQAAAYMEATGTPLARYRVLFLARQAELLARGEAAGHREHVAATLGLALSRLAGEAPAAAGLMRLLAFLAPEPVPLDLPLTPDAAGRLGAEVAGVVLGDLVAAGDAVAALRRCSLASPAGDGLVLVHRLVQAITRAQLPADAVGQWERAAAARPGLPRSDQHRHVAYRGIPRAERQLPGRSGPVRADR
jgi:hypothetical protein